MQSGCQFVNAEDCNDNYEALMKYVQISALAPPAEAHLRIATALTEVNSAHNHLQDLFILCNVSSPVNYILCSSQLCIKSRNIFCFFALNSFQKKNQQFSSSRVYFCLQSFQLNPGSALPHPRLKRLDPAGRKGTLHFATLKNFPPASEAGAERESSPHLLLHPSQVNLILRSYLFIFTQPLCSAKV